MLAALRRVYYYLITAGALLFTTGVLEYVFYQLLLRGGLATSPPDPQELTRSLVFLLVDLIVVVPVGGLHWFLLRRDLRQDPGASGGIIRTLFLTLLTLGFGLTVIFALESTVINLGAPLALQMSVALPLAATLAWGVALALVLLEWRSSGPPREDARIVATVFGLIGFWVLIIAAIIAVGQAIQSYLQALIFPLSQCTGFEFVSNPSGVLPCSYQAPPPALGATLAALVALGGLAVFFLWTRRDQNPVLRLVSTVIVVTIATITVVIFSVLGTRFVLDLASGHVGTIFPQSLLSAAPPQTTDNQPFIQSYPFLGPLLAGLGVLAYYLPQQWGRPLPEGSISRQAAITTLAVPLSFIFFIGGSILLGNAFLVMGGRTVTTDDWNTALMFLIPGLAWLGLWPALAAMSHPAGEGPTAPRRVYVLILLAVTLSAAVISLATALFVVLTGVLGTPVDSTGDTALHAFGVTLATGAGAGYYVFVLLRDGRLLRRRRAAVPAPAAPAPLPAPGTTAPSPASGASEAPPPPPLEAILAQLTQGQLTVDQAAAILRQHPEIR